MAGGSKQALDPVGKLQRTLLSGERLMTSTEDRAGLVLSAHDRAEVIRRIFTW